MQAALARARAVLERSRQVREAAVAQKEQSVQQSALLDSLLASPATLLRLGKDSEEYLGHVGRAQVLEPGEGPPILTALQQTELLALAAGGGAKAAVAQYMAPLLRALRLPGADVPLVMVSSELHFWRARMLGEAEHMTLAPDFILAWAPYVEVRGELRGFPRGVLGGSPALQRACVAELYEARGQALDLKAFGQQCLYHGCVSGPCRSALFSAEECWLLETLHTYPLRQLKMRWTTPGSAGALQRFLGAPAAPPLALLMQRVLAQLELAALGLAVPRHLGSGASGHVFAVHRAGDAMRTPLALKLVPSSGGAELFAEFASLQEAAAAGAPVVPPVPDSLCLYSASGAAASGAAAAGGAASAAFECCSGGYLLSRVGARFDATSEGGVRRAFDALAELHACGVFHGDARTPNLLAFEGQAQAQWIDLRPGTEERGAGAAAAALALERQRYDAGTLAQSMLPRTQALPAPAEEALQLYDCADPATVAALAGAVWRACESVARRRLEQR